MGIVTALGPSSGTDGSIENDYLAVPAALHDVQTLTQLFAWRLAQAPRAPAYLHHDNEVQNWVPVSWKAIADRVSAITHALALLGLSHGARIGILLPSGLDAVAFDLAALAIAGVPVPMHALDNPGSIAYILADSEASVLVVSSQAQWHAILLAGVELPSLRQVVVAGPDAAAPCLGSAAVAALNEWLATAALAPRAGHPRPAPQDLAALVYTSGTTGKPKGVMLTHANVLDNVKATLLRVAPEPDDVFLSFLPLSHTFERTAGYYVPMAAGCCVAHARSVALLSEDLERVRPTILISVPRIYERAYLALQDKLIGSWWRRHLFDVALASGWRRFCRAQGRPVPGKALAWLDELLWPAFDRFVATAVRARFGGRLRAAVCGGAALAQPIAHCFLALGVPILQGYGMTETSPVIAANSLDDNDPATVGRALVGVGVRIGDNLELQVNGASLMRGYWKREQDTAAVLVDGWLRTGDQAEICDGRIRILGRIKEIIVTSTGEKIAPADLERAITGDPLFAQAYVFGEGRPFIACAVVLNYRRWMAQAVEMQLDPAADASWNEPAVTGWALQKIAMLTRDFPSYSQPRAVIVSVAPWTVENGLLTPTLKLKRVNLARHFDSGMALVYQRPGQMRSAGAGGA